MSSTSEQREQREAERTPQWFAPQRKRSTQYEDVTVDVQPSVHRHTRFGFPIAFPDGRPSFWDDSTKLRSRDWYAFRDPGGLWERPFFQKGAAHDSEIANTLQVARDNDLYTALSTEWVDFLAAQLVPISLAEYGLVAPLSSSMRPALGDAVANCLGFGAGYKLRQAQALALYTMDLEQGIPGFSTEDGKQRFLDDPAWQPVRRYVERLASLTDWSEAIIATNLCFEPLVGSFLRREVLMRLAASHGDVVTPPYGRVAQAEWGWARDWTVAFVRLVIDDPDHGGRNLAIIHEWLEDWGALARQALDALEPVVAGVDSAFAEARARTRQDHVNLLDACGLSQLEAAAR
jgi:Methane/Phenol/Toluene Hydroxylase.